MDPARVPLRMYSAPAEGPPLEWPSTRDRLAAAGTYWVTARSSGAPHPRPVWGVWLDDALWLSLGSPVLQRELAADPVVTVHPDSGTDVVIVEGRAETVDQQAAIDAFVATYNAKYTYDYSVADYGAPLRVQPVTVLAWRAAGEAGRDGFREKAKWSFVTSES